MTSAKETNNKQAGVIEKASTRVLVAVVVVVVVAQLHMYAYACARASSVTEPKLHSSLPQHLPLHTEESLEKVHPATNFKPVLNWANFSSRT